MMRAVSQVTRFAAAEPAEAMEHFQRRLAFEADCWDVHYSLSHALDDLVLLDVRSQALYQAGHLPNAIHLPHAQIRRDTLPDLPPGGLYVVYCAGPHCNGATKAAIRIASLGLPVKEMLGGVTGWQDEGFELVVDKT